MVFVFAFAWLVAGYMLYQFFSPLFVREGKSSILLKLAFMIIWPVVAVVMLLASMLLYRDKVRNK